MAKSPAHRGVSVQQLQSDYNALHFLEALKRFLNSRTTRDKVVLPVETDRFDVYNQLYVASRPSMVTGHDSGWQKIRAKAKVAACGHQVETPARFDTAFEWDEEHQPRVFLGPDGMYQTSSS